MKERGHSSASGLVLGISAYYHDAAAALVDGGRILAAAQEERATRVKHDARFPAGAVRVCLASAGAALSDVGAVAFYDKPFLKFERILETFYARAPRGLARFTQAMPAWVKDKLLVRATLRRELASIDRAAPSLPIHFAEHHLSHAASAFFPSPFDEAAVLTVDGVGEWATASIGHGRGAELSILRELHFPHSLGLFYSALTHHLGFEVNSGEYKVMGLAPYGDPASSRMLAMERSLRERVVSLKDDGSFWMDPSFFDFEVGDSMTRDAAWEGALGVPRRRPAEPLRAEHCDLALAGQRVLSDAVLGMAREARRITGARHVCMAGGVALNCVANARIRDAGVFDDVWVQPAAGDAGGALGAALALHHIGRGAPRTALRGDAMAGSLLGRAWSDGEIEEALRGHGAVFERHDPASLCAMVAALLAEGQVVGWFQGRAEWGPRALGNRSILADARRPEMWDRLNLCIKRREAFRPFAPAVLAEDAAEWFELDRPSPYMLFVAQVSRRHRRDVPPERPADPLLLRHVARSDIPAVTHVDGSARVQTVHEGTNPLFAELLRAFRACTGCGLLANTSFNVRGEPIVDSPDDAWRCFATTDLDALAIGPFLVRKALQPAAAVAPAPEPSPALDRPGAAVARSAAVDGPRRAPRVLAWAALVVASVVSLFALDLVLGSVLLPPLKGCKIGPYHHGLKANFDAVQEWHELRYRMTTNSLGLKDERVREVPLRGDRPRILVLGDSYAEGVGFPFGETAAGRFWDAIGRDRWEVLNGAVESYSPRLYLLKLRHLLDVVGLRIDELVVFIDISDPQDDLLYDEWTPTQETYRLETFLQQHSLFRRLMRRHLVTLTPLRQRMWKDEETFERERATWTLEPGLLERWAARGLARSADHMAEVDAECRRRGIRLTIVVYPWVYQVLAGDRDSVQAAFWREFAASRGIDFVDLFPELVDPSREPDLSPFLPPPDNHWSAAGNRRVGEALARHWRARAVR
ncbi:MAG TPA: carbamoyltransferase N-terminal domain-containing protein [Anaeromyxobacter sp.]